MKYLSLVSLVIFIVLLPNASSAQSFEGVPPSEVVPDRSYMANPRFESMVRAAMMRMDDGFRFGRFRNLYVDTRQYDPLGDNTIDQMQRLAYLVQSGKGAEERAEALDDYRNLVMEHMANIRVVAQALSFAKLDSVFGSERFFSWMRKGLVRDILSVGDGQTLNTAYYVVTLSEETVLLGQLGLRVIDTQTANENTVYYSMHEVEDIRNGQRKTIFVNTTRPMRHLNYQYKLTGGTNEFTILRQ